MSIQTTNDHSLMTSTFILSGKKLIYVSRGSLILYQMQSHMLSLTPCHIAIDNNQQIKHLLNNFKVEKVCSSWFCTPVVFLGCFTRHDSNTSTLFKKYFIISKLFLTLRHKMNYNKVIKF